VNVYLVRHPWEKWIKVGIAGGVRGRMATYVHAWGCDPPSPPVVADAEMIELLGFASARDMEFDILKHFAPYSVRGEWLQLSYPVRKLEQAIADKDMKMLQRIFSIESPSAFELIRA
jgi:hypothetical protein